MVHNRDSETIYPHMQRKDYAYKKSLFFPSFYLSYVCLSVCLSVCLYLPTYLPTIPVKKGIDLSFFSSLFEEGRRERSTDMEAPLDAQGRSVSSS